MKLFCVLLFSLIVCALSCSDDDPSISSDVEERLSIKRFLDSSAISPYDSLEGFYYYPVVLNPGGKSQSEGKVLSIYYTLTVLGSDTIIEYDSTKGEPLVVKQGVGAVYPVAFDTALGLLKEGEEYVFIFPSSLAYKEISLDGFIPENSIISARIRLLKVRNEEDVLLDELEEINEYVKENELEDTVKNPLNRPKILPQGLNMVYKRLRAGNPGTKPTAGDTVSITYEIKNLDGDQLDVRGAAGAFEFTIIEGSEDVKVISGLNVGVKQMEEGERALLILPSAMAYSYSAAVIPEFNNKDFRNILVDEEIIPAYAAKVVPYEVLLVDLHLISVK